MHPYLNRQQAVLLAIFPTLALGLLNTYWKAPLLDWSVTLYWMADVTQWVVVPLLVWLLVLRPNKITLTSVGFHSPDNRLNPLRSFGVGEFVIALLVLCFAYIWVETVTTRLSWSHPSWRCIACVNLTPTHVQAVYMALTAAIVEETVYRGLAWTYISHYVKGNQGKLVYIAATSVVFASIHSEQGIQGLIPAFVFGVFAALIFIRTRNLYPVVLSHFVIDIYYFW